jgi:hypothetical protein
MKLCYWADILISLANDKIIRLWGRIKNIVLDEIQCISGMVSCESSTADSVVEENCSRFRK